MKNNDNNISIEWKGNLRNDCSAHWNDLLLSAEKNATCKLGWVISIAGKYGDEIDSANNYSHRVPTGIAAAEQIARAYIPLPKVKTSAFYKIKTTLKKFFS